MKKVFLFLFGLMLAGSVSATVYHPGTIADYQSMNTNMVGVNTIEGTKEAILSVPYIKTDDPLIIALAGDVDEGSYTFPAGTSRFMMRSREGYAWYYSYVLGGTDEHYFTVLGNEVLEEKEITAEELTIYFLISQAGTIEVSSWR